MKRFFADPFRVAFFGTLALLIVANHAFFFATPWHENGDFALNALQIERAKHLNEFYGNYSRFHFNHPGPAFFYVYAAAEYVLFDWLQAVPSPHNAHAIAGAALQALFFALSLAIAQQWIRSRWFIPLALAVAGLHFGLAQNTFVSIWPPHALLMPFLLLLISGASIAAGNARHLPWMVLAGCFLVHGHVAQPLMVGVLFGTAYILCWRRERQTPGPALWRRYPAAHLVSAACIAVFLVPLAVDLALGRESNLVQILQFSAAPKENRTWSESATYVLAFFGYEHEPEKFIPEHNPLSFAFLAKHWMAYCVWVALIPAVGLLLRRLRGTEAARFGTALLQIAAAAILAALIWGALQTGEMFEFNAHFLYGLTFALLLVPTALIAAALPERGAGVVGSVLALAGAYAWASMNLEPESSKGAEIDWAEATRQALAADPNKHTTKFLVFEHDNWGDTARTALALKRMGESYRVAPNWAYMFGRYRTAGAEELSSPSEQFSIWRLSRRPLAGPSMPLGGDLRVFFELPQLFPVSTVIHCGTGGNLEQFALFGFTAPEGDFSWTNMQKAALQFRSPTVSADVDIHITAEPFAVSKLGPQTMQLSVNGERVGSAELTARGTVRVVVPASVWNRSSTVTVLFEFPQAASPRELGIGTDPRHLAWGISRIMFGREHP